MPWLDEEEIKGKEGGDGCNDGRPAPSGDGARHDGKQIKHGDVGDVRELFDDPDGAGDDAGQGQRHNISEGPVSPEPSPYSAHRRTSVSRLGNGWYGSLGC